METCATFTKHFRTIMEWVTFNYKLQCPILVIYDNLVPVIELQLLTTCSKISFLSTNKFLAYIDQVPLILTFSHGR